MEVRRTTVYIDAPLARRLNKRADKKGRPVAHLILEHLARKLDVEYRPYRRSRYASHGFAKAATSDEKVRVQLIVPVELHEAIRKAAVKRLMSVTGFVRAEAKEMLRG